MLRKYHKSAMTLGEVCFVFIVIGVIASLAIATIRPFERSAKMLYNRMHSSLELAAYNGMMYKSEFPSTASDFCKMLLEYINTPNSEEDAQKLCETNVYSIDDSITFDKDHASLIASNGARLYILGSVDKSPLTLAKQTNGVTTENINAKFYLVLTDINGSRGKGTLESTESNMADVVGFLVTSNSIVLPIGYPTIDTRYLSARVGYPIDDTADEEDEEKLSVSMTYWEAQQKAFGGQYTPSDVMSVDTQPMIKNLKETSTIWASFEIPSTAYPTKPAVDTENQCTDNGNSPCYVKIEEFD